MEKPGLVIAACGPLLAHRCRLARCSTSAARPPCCQNPSQCSPGEGKPTVQWVKESPICRSLSGLRIT
jgi:hypothetical protein